MMDTIINLLLYKYSEFLYRLEGDVASIAIELESFFYDNEPVLMILTEDIDWLEIASWVKEPF
jgi:hypothetical protein